MASEGPGRRKFTELVTDHLLANEHRHVLAAVVNRQRQANHIRDHHRPAGPGFDGPTIIGLHRHADFFQEVKVDERTLFQRTRHDTFLNVNKLFG
jgi:hypothetical protein